MKFTSQKNSLLILGVTAFVCSKGMFLSFNDPEGPNLLIVTVMAALTFGFSFLVYRFARRFSPVRRIILAIAAQIIFVTLLAFFLG